SVISRRIFLWRTATNRASCRCRCTPRSRRTCFIMLPTRSGASSMPDKHSGGGDMNGRWCLVTGGAGFVGSRLIRALNAKGRDNIVLVDSFARRPEKLATLSQLRVADFIDYFTLDGLSIEDLDRRLPALDVIFHVGAWTDVLETDVTSMLRYNFEHSRKWLEL